MKKIPEQPRTVILAGTRAVAALASPVRMEIIDTLQKCGPSSIRELARQMARPADGLYHHVRLLLRAGVLFEKETRPVGRRQEAVYQVAGRIAGAISSSAPQGRDSMIRAATAVFRLAAREFTRAMHRPDAAALARAGGLRLSRQKAMLDDQGLKVLHRFLGRLEKTLARHPEQKQGKLFAVTVSVGPAATTRRAGPAR
jgi:hypothetical protein